MFSRTLGLVAITVLAMGCDAQITGNDHGGLGSGAGDQNAIITVDPVLPAPGDNVTFDSGNLGSGDRSWTFGDGTTATGTRVGHVYAAEGSYRVTVTLDDGTTTVDHTIDLVVDDPNTEPQISLPQLRRPR